MMSRHPFDAPPSTSFPFNSGKFLFDPDTSHLGIRLLQQLVGLPQVAQTYAQAERLQADSGELSIFDALLNVMDIRYEISPADKQRIPPSGPVIVVANHPFGMIEGPLLGSLLHQVRPDFRFMANGLLGRFPKIAEYIFKVDPFGGRDACLSNRQGLRQSFAWLQEGGMLVMFPAGEVSSFHWERRVVTDPAWNETVARLAMRSGAPVLPMFFGGRNGAVFQIAGLLHSNLRTALLPREYLNKTGKTFRLRIGGVVRTKKLADFTTDEQRIEFVRQKTYVLASREEEVNKQPSPVIPLSKWSRATSSNEPIVRATDASLVEADIAALDQDEDAILARQGDFVVYIAAANRIPHVVRELGRLREITFRQTGEGTGKSTDIDEFDSDYLHLFVWHRVEKEIAGAYRVGQSDRILRNRGLKGLYTHKLFAYRREFLERISPALEMGRSFVCEKYQRSYAPLLLLWRGICTYVCRNPRYKILFGPVSISNDYHPSSRQLIVSFLKEYCRATDLAKFVRARCPFRTRSVQGWNTGKNDGASWDLEELSAFISDIETDQKGIPVLLRQYLKWGGKLLSFSIDADFSNALDGLIIVDLLQSDPALVQRYMGKEGLASFLSYHAQPTFRVR